MYQKFRLIFLLLLPFMSFAQNGKTDVTGLWKGTLYNDSTGLYYKYEIGISSNKGKLSGFSHTWFILDDKQYYGVKKVKIRWVGDKLIVEDDGLIANNYPVLPDKGVRQLNVLELTVKDSLLTLTGPFSTNRTRQFSSLTGTISLERKNDYWKSSLLPHLQELGRLDQLSFVEPPETLDKKLYAASEKQSAVALKNSPITTTVKPASQSGVTVNPDVLPEKKKTVTEKPLAAAQVNERVSVAQETIFFKNDSLQLTLYDNGEVDGDTVSILLNGKLILSNQRLSTNAIRHTIYIEPSTDSITLLMYAENLGSIAPNTGLLVVKDGSNQYEVRFSGDLQKNAAIIFKRRK
jgi:hypothetical protein